MGGSAGIGNATAVAEFNVWHDPEAAAARARLGRAVLHVRTRRVPARRHLRRIFWRYGSLSPTTRWSRSPGSCSSHRISFSADQDPAAYSGLIGDAGAVCALIAHPDALGVETLPVRVELMGHARGQTVVDRRAPGRRGSGARPGGRTSAPVEVALEVDADRLAQVFLDTLELGESVEPAPSD